MLGGKKGNYTLLVGGEGMPASDTLFSLDWKGEIADPNDGVKRVKHRAGVGVGGEKQREMGTTVTFPRQRGKGDS